MKLTIQEQKDLCAINEWMNEVTENKKITKSDTTRIYIDDRSSSSNEDWSKILSRLSFNSKKKLYPNQTNKPKNKKQQLRSNQSLDFFSSVWFRVGYMCCFIIIDDDHISVEIECWLLLVGCLFRWKFSWLPPVPRFYSSNFYLLNTQAPTHRHINSLKESGKNQWKKSMKIEQQTKW